MTGKLREIIPLAGGEWIVSFTTRSNPGVLFDSLKDKDVSVEIKKAGKPRSRDANAFCWALCSDIGKALNPPLSKEDVYRMAIKAVGVYTQTLLMAWDVEKVKERWESHGTGWFLETVDDSHGLVGHKVINLYYGSSTYTVDEMRTLLEWLVDQAEQMQLVIPLSKADEEEMLKRWGEK